MNAKETLILAGLGLVAVYLIAKNAETVGESIATGAGNAIVGAANGIANAVNGAINGAIPPSDTGRPRTAGEWLWDLLHPTAAYELEHGVNIYDDAGQGAGMLAP